MSREQVALNSDVLAEFQALARQEGRPLEALVEEALADLLEKRKTPRPHVMDAYLTTHEPYRELYKKLAQ